jgi:hypothetical protein
VGTDLNNQNKAAATRTKLPRQTTLTCLEALAEREKRGKSEKGEPGEAEQSEPRLVLIIGEGQIDEKYANC